MISYEWVVEYIPDRSDDDGDIVEVNHFDTFNEAFNWVLDSAAPFDHDIALVRDVGNDAEGIIDRAWAYLNEDDKLPETFTYSAGEDSGIRVPKRYHTEVTRRLK